MDHTLFICVLELLVALVRAMGPRSLRLGSVFHDGERVLLVWDECVVHALHVHDLLILFDLIYVAI